MIEKYSFYCFYHKSFLSGFPINSATSTAALLTVKHADSNLDSSVNQETGSGKRLAVGSLPRNELTLLFCWLLLHQSQQVVAGIFEESHEFCIARIAKKSFLIFEYRLYIGLKYNAFLL